MSGYYKTPRTELTANEKIALELIECWSNCNMDTGYVDAKKVLDNYMYFRDKLNEEGKSVC